MWSPTSFAPLFAILFLLVLALGVVSLVRLLVRRRHPTVVHVTTPVVPPQPVPGWYHAGVPGELRGGTATAGVRRPDQSSNCSKHGLDNTYRVLTALGSTARCACRQCRRARA